MWCTSRSRVWEWSVELVETPGTSSVRATWPWKAVEALSHDLLRHTVACQHRFSLSKGLRSGCAPHHATARPCFRVGRFLPIIDVTVSDIGRLLASSFSQRSRKLSLETARLAPTTATQRPPAATDSMHTGLGSSARRGEPSAPCFDLTGTLSRLRASREVEAKMDGRDGLVDGMVYWAREIVAHRFPGGQRAGEQ
jgi:hypothetical protein